MRASELRIGNWVYLFGDPVQLTKEHIIYLLGKDSLPESITLTEEWLLKFGLEDISDLHPTFRLNQYIIEENVMRSGRWRVRQIINAEGSLCISPEITQTSEFLFRARNRINH